MDFVYLRRGRKPMAIECKWSADDFDFQNLVAFRGHHPGGENYVVSTDIGRSFVKKHKDISVQFVTLQALIRKLTN